MKHTKLGVNIDHIATLREARKIDEPDPVYGAVLAELGGADGITVHLREDRRHIKERDVEVLRRVIKTRLNLEMAVADDVVEFALKIKPDEVCIVPEKRQEITTEGGLDVVSGADRLKDVIKELKNKGITVSLFVDPDKEMLKASREVSADFVELHTGTYANAKTEEEALEELEKLVSMARFGKTIGLRINAGHGLNYQNVVPVARIPEIEVLNIGHSIIGRAVFVGLVEAVREMKKLITEA